MNKPNITKLILLLVVGALLIPLTFYPQALSQNFEMFTDVLDSFGGRASSANFSERISSGGQPGVVGVSEGTNLYALQGYVHAAAFEHGDANADGGTGLADAVYLINYVLKGGSEPVPFETGDVDCDNVTGITDVVYLINYLFRGGLPPCNL